MSPIDYERLPQSMIDARRAKGWGRGRLAKESGVHLQSIRNYETGKCIPGLYNAVLLADSLELPLDEYMGRTIERKIPQ